MFRRFVSRRCAVASSSSSALLQQVAASPQQNQKTEASTNSNSDDNGNNTEISGDSIGNRFAAKPKPTARWVLNLAAEKHDGLGVYRSRQDVADVLQALRVTNPPWWCYACDEVLARMLALARVPMMNNNWNILQRKGAVIVIEGLDGVGKSTVTRSLATPARDRTLDIFSAVEKKKRTAETKPSEEAEEEGEKTTTTTPRIPGAVLMATPPAHLDIVRAKFRVLEDPIARAFYSAANYIAADEVSRASADHVVVLDRWWNSTSAMALSQRSLILSAAQQREAEAEAARKRDKTPIGGGGMLHTMVTRSAGKMMNMMMMRSSSSNVDGGGDDMNDVRTAEELEQLETSRMVDLLPPEGALVYQWPEDLPHVDLRVLLDCPEEVRTRRMAKRGDENVEEKVLAEKRAMRETAMTAYSRMTPELERVEAPNYAAAVNMIIDKIEARADLMRLMPEGKPRKFSQEFVESVKPY